MSELFDKLSVEIYACLESSKVVKGLWRYIPLFEKGLVFLNSSLRELVVLEYADVAAAIITPFTRTLGFI